MKLFKKSMQDELNKYREFTTLLLFFIPVVILAILLLLTGGIVKMIAGVLIVFILPGYLFLQILWPSNESLDRLHRTTMVLPTSMAIVSVLLLVINYFFIYRYEYSVMGLAVVEVIFGLSAYWRKRKFISSKNSITRMRSYSKSMKATKWNLPQIFLGISILTFSISILYTFITPRQSRDITEFFLVEPISYIESQQFNIKYGADVNLAVAIGNYESENHEYHIEVWGGKSTDGELKLIKKIDGISVKENGLVERTIRLKLPPEFNSHGVEVLLYIDDDPDPYRKLLIWMEVET